MKTERRHELQTNQLANWIGHQFDHVKPHGKTVLGAAILGAAVIVGAIVFLKDRESAESTAWTEFQTALVMRDPVVLADVAKKNTGANVALWARLSQADLELDRGVMALYTNREEAMLALSDARKAYSDVIAGGGSVPELMQKGLIGMAKAQEAAGNLDAAKDFYQQVKEKYPDAVVGREASNRLAEISDPEVAKWYNWFSREKPRPSSRSSLPNIPGMPDDLLHLPDMPNLPPAPEGGPLARPQDVPESKLPGSSNLPPDPEGGALFPPLEIPAASPPATTSPTTAPEDKKSSAESPKTESTPPPAAPNSEKELPKETGASSPQPPAKENTTTPESGKSDSGSPK